jgi:predicted ArsR family transcriptional regulator
MIQYTRRLLLEIIHARGEATVEELTAALRERTGQEMSAVTVRHHLDVLRAEGLISPPALRRSGARGRPQHVYTLTERAHESLPTNYSQVVRLLIEQIKASLPDNQVNVILEGVADQMADEARALFPALAEMPLGARLDQIVSYLNQHGYEAAWEQAAEGESGAQGYILRTRNCPYRRVVGDHGELCGIDMRLIAALTGVVPRNLGRLAEGGECCAYHIPVAARAG